MISEEYKNMVELKHRSQFPQRRVGKEMVQSVRLHEQASGKSI